jgi:hypothetical protein
MRNFISFFIVSLTLLIGCDLGIKKKPIISFSKDTVDLGNIVLGSNYTIIYNLKNIGNDDLLLDTATASCGCTKVSLNKKIIQPGDSTNLILTFSPPDTGRFYKNVILKSNVDSNFNILYFHGYTKIK